MNTESKQFTPAEFVAKLKEEADHPLPLAFVGMLKTAEDDQHLMFAQGVSCAHWTAIPTDQIETIELISEVPCKDHSHPLVKMQLKAPASEEAAMYASLAQSCSFMNSASQGMGDLGLALMQRVKDFRGGKSDVMFRNSGPDGWFPCWSRCMDDLLDFASEQPADQWKFWSSLAYQLCGQICP
jgi:hypothetical protein